MGGVGSKQLYIRVERCGARHNRRADVLEVRGCTGVLNEPSRCSGSEKNANCFFLFFPVISDPSYLRAPTACRAMCCFGRLWIQDAIP